MNQDNHTGILPHQYTGKEIKAEAECSLLAEDEAISFYQTARHRLLNVNNWHELAGTFGARFTLIGHDKKEVHRNVQIGDFFKVDIPGPGSHEGDGFDWVKVEDVREIDEAHLQSTAIRVRPCANPFGQRGEIAHFYSDESTSVFVITRCRSTVRAAIIDRNLKPNNSARSLKDKVRDVAVGIWSIGLFSKIQWKNLAHGLVKSE